MLLASIIIYLLLNLLIGWAASRRVKSSSDFVVAGRRLPLIIAASAMFATWFGSETVMGASSEFVENGLIGVIEDPFGAALCLFLIGAFFARPLYRMNILTFSDYFRIRFGKKAELLSAVLLVPTYFGWIAAQLVAMGIILNQIAGLELGWGIFICTMVVLIYTWLGGMWAVSITDFVQTIMIIVGLMTLLISLLIQTGGWAPVAAAQPEGFFSFLPENSIDDWMTWFAAWIAIGLGSIPQQDVFQRVMASKSEKVAVRAAYSGSVMYLVIAFIPLVTVLCGNYLYPELASGTEGDSQAGLLQIVLHHAGLPVQILFFGALLSAILSTTSGAVLAPAAVLGENIIRPRIRLKSDRHLLVIIRMSVLVIALLSAGLAMLKSNIYELVGESSILSLVSLFVPLTAGLYWKKASSYGAILSMVFGIVAYIVGEYLFELPHTSIWALLAGTITMIAGSLIKPGSDNQPDPA